MVTLIRIKDDYLVKVVYFPNQYRRNFMENSVETEEYDNDYENMVI